jgi:NAD(P)-dependent dehydrogenase (short-subunit alcohol dehydrogenase family)
VKLQDRSLQDKSLMDKKILITGASRGLGACVARTMWRGGASLLLVARSEKALLDLGAELMSEARDGAQQVHTFAADLGVPEAVAAIMSEARRQWARIDVLVNNAAILGPIGKVWENDWEEWQMAIQVNLLAPVELCRACIPWMKEYRQGKIINLSGGGATMPRPNFSAYAVAKAGLVRFSETLAHEVGDIDVQVNCVAPGPMNTDMLQAILRAGPEKTGDGEYTRAIKQGEEGKTMLQRAADLCVFLASPASSGITGKLISAVWDPWDRLPEHLDGLRDCDIYTLRRIVPRDRNKDWG